MSKYNFPKAKFRNSYNTVKFSIKRNNISIDLTDTVISVKIIKSEVIKAIFSTTNGKVLITDAADGKFETAFGVINLIDDNYLHEIEILYPNGELKTYLKGQFIVE